MKLIFILLIFHIFHLPLSAKSEDEIHLENVISNLLLFNNKVKIRPISHANVKSIHLKNGLNVSYNYEYFHFESDHKLKELSKVSKILKHVKHVEVWDYKVVTAHYKVLPEISQKFKTSIKQKCYMLTWSRGVKRFSLKMIVIPGKKKNQYFLFIEDHTGDFGAISFPDLKFTEKGKPIKN